MIAVAGRRRMKGTMHNAWSNLMVPDVGVFERATVSLRGSGRARRTRGRRARREKRINDREKLKTTIPEGGWKDRERDRTRGYIREGTREGTVMVAAKLLHIV